jgi:plastocyanin
MILIAASLPIQTDSSQTAPASSPTQVSGEVTLLRTTGVRETSDASKIVVWLVPMEPAQQANAAPAKTHYRLVQRDKRFEPDLLVVPTGSVVDFPNLDPWFHNVFSLYRGKRFDLGLYQAGAQKSVRFDRPGPSYLFCNIHPEMTGVVLAVDSTYFGTTDKAGRYTIAQIPPGKYMLHAWYEYAAPDALQALRLPVTIEGANETLPAISVTATKVTQANHKNKYGQDYDKNKLTTDY